MSVPFQGGIDSTLILSIKAIHEINSLIKWHVARKKWHSDKTKQKTASSSDPRVLICGGGMMGSSLYIRMHRLRASCKSIIAFA
ncbi:hypothetical protein BKA66DRAFT_469521 [Pyrenochaeta sp. MPI-SDFR-AT-0127]|nr:hypothetical protein BKA66DRAFT_469521 [Pyrenochaeta sp. MPI-SDFR-AT-0127]